MWVSATCSTALAYLFFSFLSCDLDSGLEELIYTCNMIHYLLKLQEQTRRILGCGGVQWVGYYHLETRVAQGQSRVARYSGLFFQTVWWLFLKLPSYLSSHWNPVIPVWKSVAALFSSVWIQSRCVSVTCVTVKQLAALQLKGRLNSRAIHPARSLLQHRDSLLLAFW